MTHLLLFALLATLTFATSPQAQPTQVIVVDDTPVNGIFDASVEVAPGASEGWLVYSAVFGTIQPWGPHVETHLARTTDAGATWTFDGVINASFFDTLILSGGGTEDGVVRIETLTVGIPLSFR